MGKEFGLRVEPKPSPPRPKLAGFLRSLFQRDENSSFDQLGDDTLAIDQDYGFSTGLRFLVGCRFCEPGKRYKIRRDFHSGVLAPLRAQLAGKSVQILAAGRILEGFALRYCQAFLQAVFRFYVDLSSATSDIQANIVLAKRYKEVAH
jgi:hypothetical protein